MGGSGVDQLDADLSQLALEGHLEPVEAAGEAQVVVREQLPGYPVGGAGGHEAGPGRLAAQTVHRERGQQEAGVVIDDVDHPARPLTGERDLSRVDLPEVVGQFALETPPRLDRRGGCGATRRLRLSAWWIVDTAGGSDPGAGNSAESPRAPTRVPRASSTFQLERRRSAPRAARPPRPLGQAGSALVQIPPPVAVEARPRDAMTRAHLGHRFAGRRAQTAPPASTLPSTPPSKPSQPPAPDHFEQRLSRRSAKTRRLEVPERLDVSRTNVSDVSGTIRLRSLRT